MDLKMHITSCSAGREGGRERGRNRKGEDEMRGMKKSERRGRKTRESLERQKNTRMAGREKLLF